MGRATDRRTVLRIDTANGQPVKRPDTLAAEEPLEIRVGSRGAARPPPLAVTMRTPGDDLDLAIGFLLTEGLIGAADDVLTAQLCAGTDTPNTYNVVDVVLAEHVPPPETDPARNFYTTSSLLREDVGRHNAVDKVIGWAVRERRLPLRGHLLLVSGRASFELTQKAWMAGVPLLAAVSAPSTLAADLAAQAGMTLVGFLRGPTMNVYAALTA